MTSANTTTSPAPTPEEDPPFPLTAIDKHLLSIPDSSFSLITWPDLRHIISSNTLEELKRRPSDLRRYLAWSAQVKSSYGSITSFVIRERLHWTPLPPSLSTISSSSAAISKGAVEVGEGSPKFDYNNAIPFEDESDYAILRNDWPYGFENGIAHLLVWSKTPIEVDDERGDVTERARLWIEDFVTRVFTRALESRSKDGNVEGKGEERVLWFKNWVSLQSVRGVDHVHVLVRDAPEDLLELWTTRKDV